MHIVIVLVILHHVCHVALEGYLNTLMTKFLIAVIVSMILMLIWKKFSQTLTMTLKNMQQTASANVLLSCGTL